MKPPRDKQTRPRRTTYSLPSITGLRIRDLFLGFLAAGAAVTIPVALQWPIASCVAHAVPMIRTILQTAQFGGIVAGILLGGVATVMTYQPTPAQIKMLWIKRRNAAILYLGILTPLVATGYLWLLNMGTPLPAGCLL